MFSSWSKTNHGNHENLSRVWNTNPQTPLPERVDASKELLNIVPDHFKKIYYVANASILSYFGGLLGCAAKSINGFESATPSLCKAAEPSTVRTGRGEDLRE